jgi:chromosome segregation ATPase
VHSGRIKTEWGYKMNLFEIKEYLNITSKQQIEKIKEELSEVEKELDSNPQNINALYEEVADLLQSVYTLSKQLKLCDEKMSFGLYIKIKERGLTIEDNC